MLNLTDGMMLYHGSYTAVPKIDLDRCNKGLDFGRGFYVTTSYEQALSFVRNSVKRNIREGNIPEDFDVADGQVSVYQFHANSECSIQIFQDAGLDWLHFIAANRNTRLFRELFNALGSVDIVGGKIANDNTSRTLTGYINGLYGMPGSEMTDSFVIQALLPNRLQDQFCFRTWEAIKCLEYIRSDRYGDIRGKDRT